MSSCLNSFSGSLYRFVSKHLVGSFTPEGKLQPYTRICPSLNKLHILFPCLETTP